MKASYLLIGFLFVVAALGMLAQGPLAKGSRAWIVGREAGREAGYAAARDSARVASLLQAQWYRLGFMRGVSYSLREDLAGRIPGPSGGMVACDSMFAADQSTLTAESRSR